MTSRTITGLRGTRPRAVSLPEGRYIQASVSSSSARSRQRLQPRRIQRRAMKSSCAKASSPRMRPASGSNRSAWSKHRICDRAVRATVPAAECFARNGVTSRSRTTCRPPGTVPGTVLVRCHRDTCCVTSVMNSPRRTAAQNVCTRSGTIRSENLTMVNTPVMIRRVAITARTRGPKRCTTARSWAFPGVLEAVGRLADRPGVLSSGPLLHCGEVRPSLRGNALRFGRGADSPKSTPARGATPARRADTDAGGA